MEFVKLSAESREMTKKGGCRKLRGAGKIPAVLYGRNMESRNLAISAKDLEKAIRDSRTRELFFNVELTGGVYPVMVKSIQKNPVTGSFVHADFYHLELDRKMIARVSLNVQGHAKGVDLGGTLRIVEKMVTVRCLPENVPVALDVDVTGLGLGKTLYMKDIVAPQNVEILFEGNSPVVTVLLPKGTATEGEEGEEEENKGE